MIVVSGHFSSVFSLLLLLLPPSLPIWYNAMYIYIYLMSVYIQCGLRKRRWKPSRLELLRASFFLFWQFLFISIKCSLSGHPREHELQLTAVMIYDSLHDYFSDAATMTRLSKRDREREWLRKRECISFFFLNKK